MNFKIGQEVVCINASNQFHNGFNPFSAIKEGEVYEVKMVTIRSCCGVETIDVGIRSTSRNEVCICGHKKEAGIYRNFNSNRFAPLLSSTQSEELSEIIEEVTSIPEFA